MGIFCSFFEQNASYVYMKILRLNLAGQPIEWLAWQQALCLYARDLVVWTLGDVVREVRGGICRRNGRQSVQTLPGIIACGGDRLTPPRQFHRLSNPALFSRDAYTCMYCGNRPGVGLLTRDHVQPKSRGGQDRWENVVTACRRCNQFKSNRTPQEARMQLLELPFRPNNAEFLALINERRISAQQLDFLRSQFSRNSRLR